jgi:hypothetical protein
MTSMDIRKAFKEGTLMDAEGNPVTDKDEMYQMAYLADLKKNPAKYAFAKGGGVDYFDREDFYNKNPRLPRRIEISKSQYIKNKDFISKQKWARNIVDTQGYEDNNGVEFIEFDIEVNEKSSWDMWGWINENIPSSERKVFVQDERFLEYAKGGGVDIGLNERGEHLVIGIENLKKVLNHLPKVEFFTDRNTYILKDVTDKGFVTDKGLYGWKNLDDRHTEKDGIMLGYNDFQDYFYFKLTDEERANNPYGFYAEKMADIEDKFRDTEEEGYLYAQGGMVKKSDFTMLGAGLFKK